MALWKDSTTKDSMFFGQGDTATAAPPDQVARGVPGAAPAPAEPARRTAERAVSGSVRESLIAADVTIEGKIEGAGHVRIAGRFKGDVNVQGNVTVEQGAHVTGQLTAATVTVSGEVHGNINASSRIELLETGVINGDVKAAVLTVAAGARMRGGADFGWPDQAK